MAYLACWISRICARAQFCLPTVRATQTDGGACCQQCPQNPYLFQPCAPCSYQGPFADHKLTPASGRARVFLRAAFEMWLLCSQPCVQPATVRSRRPHSQKLQRYDNNGLRGSLRHLALFAAGQRRCAGLQLHQRELGQFPRPTPWPPGPHLMEFRPERAHTALLRALNVAVVASSGPRTSKECAESRRLASRQKREHYAANQRQLWQSLPCTACAEHSQQLHVSLEQLVSCDPDAPILLWMLSGCHNHSGCRPHTEQRKICTQT